MAEKFSSRITEFNAKLIRETLRVPGGKSQQDFFEHRRAGRSLILTISTRGTKTWSALFYEAGKPRRKKLGRFPDVDCGRARKLCDNFDAEGELAISRAGSFEVVAAQWFKRHVEGQDLRSANEIRRHLQRYIFPKWKDKDFVSIRRGEVNELLDQIEDRNGRTQANAVLATIRKLMRWYQAREESYTCPVVPGMKRGSPTRRDRWLSNDEIRAVWEACEAFDDDGRPMLHPTFGAIVRVLLLTGARREKVAQMRWSDLVEKETRTGKVTEWRIRRAVREKGSPIAITLPTTAVEIISTLPRIYDSEYVFAGRGQTSFNAWSQRKSELDALLPQSMPRWVLHDLRRTMRKLLTRCKVSLDVAEIALGHSLVGIRRTYDDVSEYRDDIDAALKMVEAEIARILNPDAKVIPFPR